MTSSNKIIKKINDTAAEINRLKEAVDRLVEYLWDTFPLKIGDRFKYDGEYKGKLIYIGINDPSEGPLFVWVEFLKDDGEYDAEYNVDPDKLEKIEPIKED